MLYKALYTVLISSTASAMSFTSAWRLQVKALRFVITSTATKSVVDKVKSSVRASVTESVDHTQQSFEYLCLPCI